VTELISWILAIAAANTLVPATVRPLATGDELPELRGEFLTGKAAVLPAVSGGRPALLLLGFTYDSRFAVEAWAKRFREHEASKSSATFFEIPMIGGMAKLGKWFIDRGMRRGTPKDDYEHVITVYSETGEWKQRVGFQDPKAAYVILIDKRGRVAWLHRGGFDEASFGSLVSALQQMVPDE
jgi:hypothetical protein